MTTPIQSTDTSKYAPGTVIKTDGSTTTTKAGSGLDKDAFLKLMVAQLKYQSPDSPVDSSKFMEQSAQFSMMEAIQNMAKDQASMLTAQRSAEATSMLGQKVTANPTVGDKEVSGVVTGVRLGTDGPVLKIGDTEVPLANVKEVSKPLRLVRCEELPVSSHLTGA